jgi:hypothetical protein
MSVVLGGRRAEDAAFEHEVVALIRLGEAIDGSLRARRAGEARALCGWLAQRWGRCRDSEEIGGL